MPDDPSSALEEIRDELGHIRDCIEIASELPMTADPRRVVKFQAPRLLGAIKAALKPHVPITRRPGWQLTCSYDNHRWPCPEVEAITAELTLTSPPPRSGDPTSSQGG